MSKDLTKTIEVKIPLKPEQFEQLLKQISDAYKAIGEAELQLKMQQDEHKEIKKKQEAIVGQALSVYNKGFTVKEVKTTVVYDKNVATFYDVDFQICDSQVNVIVALT